MRRTKFMKVASVICLVAGVLGGIMVYLIYFKDPSLDFVSDPGLKALLEETKHSFGPMRPVYYVLSGILGVVLSSKGKGLKFLRFLGIALLLFAVVSSMIAVSRVEQGDRSLQFIVGAALYSLYVFDVPLLYFIGTRVCRANKVIRRF